MNLEIKYNPLKEIVIHEINVFRSAADMACVYATAKSNWQCTFRWVDGVLFHFNQVDEVMSNVLSEDMIAGRIHWEWVSVAPMPRYQEKVTLEDFVSIPVKESSYSQKYVDIGKFLKEYLQSKIEANEAYPHTEKIWDLTK